MEMITDRCDIDSRKSPMMVVIGKKDTGKSFLVRDILHTTQRHFPVGTVISATEVANEFFQHMVPSKFIHDKYRPEIVMNVIKRQMNIKQKRNEDKKTRGGSSSVDPRAFLILDDCLYDAKSWINEESTRYVFMNGRHIDLMTIITMQYPLGITPNLRTNVDFVFILRENILGNRRRIYENYAGMFRPLKCFVRSWTNAQRTLNVLLSVTMYRPTSWKTKCFGIKPLTIHRSSYVTNRCGSTIAPFNLQCLRWTNTIQ